MEAEDYGFYQGLVYLLEHDISDLGYEITFSAEVRNFNLLTYSIHLLPKLTRKEDTEMTSVTSFLCLYC